MWMYFVVKAPVLKRHPTTLAIYKCLFDVVFVQQYLWLPFVAKSYFYSDDLDEAPFYCNSSKAAGYLAFLTQFSLLGSELCFLVISVDLRMAYTNPFTSYKQNRIYFAAFVLGFALLTSFALVSMGPRVYGLSTEGIVWIQERRQNQSPNWAKLILFYIIISSIYLYCIWANFQFYRSNEKGLSRTISNRISIMQRSKKFTLGYIIYDTVTLLLEFISYLAYSDSSTLKSLPAYFYCFRGVCALAVIIYSNWNEITWENMNPFKFTTQSNMVENVALEGLLLQPHLNTALRAEILYFTTQGIMYAAKEYELQNKRIRQAAPGNGNNNSNNKNNIGDDDNDKDDEDNSSGGFHNVNDKEDRLYSFDDHPGGGLRPSIMDDRGSSIFPRRTTNNPMFQQQNNSSSNNVNIVDDNNSIALSARPSMRQSRDTFSAIQRLNKEQNDKVALLYDDALEEEVENLGLSSVRPSLQKNSNLGLGGNNAIKRGSGGNMTMSFSMRMTVPFLVQNDLQRTSQPPTSNNSNNNLSSTNYNSSSNNLNNSSNNNSNNQRNTMNSSIDSSSDGRFSNGSAGTGSSSVTVKWRDTMDVEFSMRQSLPDTYGTNNNNNNNSSNKYDDGEFTGWRRVDSESNESARVRSHETDQSSGSTGDKLKKQLKIAINNASVAAKSVFTAYQDFRFKDFCPVLFAKIRTMCGITPRDYAKCFETTCKERFSEGRSGAFMFYSSDQKCIVKTTTKEELMGLHKMLPEYVNYLTQNPNSLIVRFLGAHCITMYGVELHFVVMLNLFPNIQLSERYDLKGSWVNRHGYTGSKRTRSERQRRQATSTTVPLFQDNDLQQKLSLMPEVIQPLSEQIRKDVIFLKDLTRMDYSLLVGVKREKFEVVPSTVAQPPPPRPSQSSQQQTQSQRNSEAVAAITGNSNQSYNKLPKNADNEPTLPKFNAIKVANNNENAATTTNNNTNNAIDNNNDTVTVDGANAEDIFKRDANGGLRARIVEGPGTYYIGIIDILQDWNFSKRLERFFKVYFKQLDGDGLSALDPIRYADRFWKRCVIDTIDGLDTEDDYLVNTTTTHHKKRGTTNSVVTTTTGQGTLSLHSTLTGATYGDDEPPKFAHVIRSIMKTID